ncbi:MAG: hypothetical protein M3Y77_20720 [Actinomycetota bacterium]|nr:hypothetical protein [Actinomycetota bacterium]
MGIAILAGVVAALISRNAILAMAPLEVAIVGTGLVAFGSQALRIRRSWITVDESEVNWQGVFKRRQLRRGPDLRGVYGPVIQPRAGSVRMLMFTDGQHRVRLVAGLWAETDLLQISDELQLEVTDLPRTARQIEERVPGTTTAIARHPYRTAFAAAGLVLLGAGIAAVVLVLTVGDAPVNRGPAQVSATTIADQNLIVRNLKAVLGGSGWRPEQATLQACDGGGNLNSPGWLRHVMVLNDQPAPGMANAVPQAQAILTRAGYGSFDNERDGTTVVLDGYRDVEDDTAAVEIQVDHGYASIELTSVCQS